MTNTSVRKIVDKLELLVDVSDGIERRRFLWNNAVKHYRTALEILRKKLRITLKKN